MILFWPEKRLYLNKEGETVLEAAKKAGIFCENICGGNATCGKCRVKVELGEFNSITKEEEAFFSKDELQQGYRLACCLYPKYWFKTCEITVEEKEKKQEIIIEKQKEKLLVYQKQVEKVIFEIEGEKEEQKIRNNITEDNEEKRIKNKIAEDNEEKKIIDDTAYKQIGDAGYKNKYGVAIDIGTTNMEALFWELSKGECVARMICPNPQQRYGADVVSRIGYAMEKKENFKIVCNELSRAICNMIELFFKSENKLEESIKNENVEELEKNAKNENDEKLEKNANNENDEKLEKNANNENNEKLEKNANKKIDRGMENQKETEKKKGFESILEKIVVAGNAVMMHFFAKEDINGFSKAPYHGCYKEGRKEKADILGLENTDLYLLPNIESFVGADTVGVMLYLEKSLSENNVLIVDIGTNGEIILQTKGKRFVASTAAGPAFEGASITYGMRAEEGAIYGISFDEEKKENMLDEKRNKIDDKNQNNSFGEKATQIDEKKQEMNFHKKLKVIGNKNPKGICGSGLIEIVAWLYRLGVIDESGYLISREEVSNKEFSDEIVNRLDKREKERVFVLYKDEEREVLITQKDIRELQLAKAAILGGINTMLKKYKLKPEDVDRCYLAGAFGNYLDVKSAIKIGLLPPIDSKKISPIGNGALMGASCVLMEQRSFENAKRMAAEVEHISLSDEKIFHEEFLKGMEFAG